jgi:putative membrane protein
MSMVGKLWTHIIALFKAERHLWRDPKLWLGAIAIILVPFINCALFTGSMWDPYRKLDRMPVALVNLDDGATVAGNKVNLGTTACEKLLSSKAFNFMVHSNEESATEALRSGQVRAVLVMPKDLSKRAATGIGGKPGQIKLIISEGQSFFASRISENLGNTLAMTLTTSIHEKRWIALAEIGPKIKTALGEIKSALSRLNSGAQTLADSEDQLVKGSSQLNEGIDQSHTGAKALSQGAKDLHIGVALLVDGISMVRDGLVQLNTAVPGEAQLLPLSKGIIQLTEGTSKLASASRALSDGSQTAALSAVRLSEGTDQLKRAVIGNWLSPSTLKEGVKTLSEGSDKLTIGISELSRNMAAAASGTQELSTSSISLKDGVETLVQGNIKIKQALDFIVSSIPSKDKIGALSKGSSQLVDGTATLSNGLDTLSSGSSTLKSGANNLAAGAKTLSSGISTLNDKIPASISIPLADPHGMAEAVSLLEVKENALPNTGTGFAPYFMSINLWIGTLLTTFFLPYRSICRSTSHTTQAARMIAKMIIPLIIVSCQAITLVLGMGIFGIHYVQILPAFVIALISSWCFLSLIVSFIFLAGDAGRLLALILLIFQAATAGGTFPIELSGNIYQVLHTILPLSATITGLRFSISGAYSELFYSCLLKLGLTITFAAFIMFIGRRKWQVVDDNKFTGVASW